MSMFGSKSSETTVPQYIEDAGKQAMGMANQRNAVGYVPYYGPETAGFTPMQVASMHGANLQAGALGLPQAEGSFQQTTDFGGGMHGYNSAAGMDNALARLKSAKPDIYNMLMRIQEMQRGGAMGQQGQMDQMGQQARGLPEDPYGGERPENTGATGAGFGGFGDFARDVFDGGGLGGTRDNPGSGITGSFSKGMSGLRDSIGNAFGGSDKSSKSSSGKSSSKGKK